MRIYISIQIRTRDSINCARVHARRESRLVVVVLVVGC